MFRWWVRRRRRKILAEPFPPAWLDILRADVGHYALLPSSDQAKLRVAVQILLAEKSWEGCRGLELTEAMRVTIAALAGVLVLGLPEFYFDNVQTILVYPEDFVIRDETPVGGEVALQGEKDVEGVAHYRGPVILAWPEVESAAHAPGRGENLAFHEFAHQLDMLNGSPDGTPNLASAALATRWGEVMNREYRRLRAATRRHRRTVLDPYGATDPAEFFAVTTESFFDDPLSMQAELPELYALFQEYYRQDPARWSWPDAERSK